jgi:hypothetical protein
MRECTDPLWPTYIFAGTAHIQPKRDCTACFASENPYIKCVPSLSVLALIHIITMIDPYTIIPIITGVLSATVQISLAIQRWWQTKRDQRIQYESFQSSQPTSEAAKELQSLMDVQSAFWRSNPGMWQALGKEAASTFAISKSGS